MAVLLVVAVLTAVALLAPGTANALGVGTGLNPLDEVCKPDQHMVIPEGADNGTTSSTNRVTRYTASGDEAEGRGFAVVTSVDAQLVVAHATGVWADAWRLGTTWPARIAMAITMVLVWPTRTRKPTHTRGRHAHGSGAAYHAGGRWAGLCGALAGLPVDNRRESSLPSANVHRHERGGTERVRRQLRGDARCGTEDQAREL